MCGVIGVLGPRDVLEELSSGLFNLQHRGQDAAGLATFDGETFHLHKDEGMVNDVLGSIDVARFRGPYGIAHVRYPTVGCGGAEDAQPFLAEHPHGIVLAHNGNLTNYAPLKEELKTRDRRYVGSNCDAEVILHVLAEELARLGGRPVEEAIFDAVGGVFRRCRGSYSVVAAIAGHGLLAFRDPFGIKPLIYGERPASGGEGFPTRMFASESCALTATGFQPVRDIRAGEAILVTPEGRLVARQVAPSNHHPCIFEYIYFASPDSKIDGVSVYRARLRLGAELAKRFRGRHPAQEVDVVVPVPDSSRPAAQEMAKGLGRECREGLLKNRYVGRTFIMPAPGREKSVQRKLRPVPAELEGKRVLLVDDSIVRGTTSRQIVAMVRQNGAKEVHFASSCPPLRHPCVYGIDMQTKKDFIAGRLSEEAIRDEIHADSLTYQEIEGMIRAVQAENPSNPRFCMACMDGNYPTGDVDASVLERIAGERERDGASTPLFPTREV